MIIKEKSNTKLTINLQEITCPEKITYQQQIPLSNLSRQKNMKEKYKEKKNNNTNNIFKFFNEYPVKFISRW